MNTNFCTMSEMALLRLYELAFKYRDEAMITMVSNEIVTRLQPNLGQKDPSYSARNISRSTHTENRQGE